MGHKKASDFVHLCVPGFLLLATLLCAPPLRAQAPSGQQAPAEQQITPGINVDSARKSSDLPTSITTENNPGVNGLGYEVKQSFEFGVRVSDFTGSQAVWDTFVNLGSGPRLMEYTLDMHSPKHTGLLFDDLSFNNFGYGGEPNNVSRLRISKGKLYNFNASFRRDQNIFDYDLLANPLNPPGSIPNIPVLNSPHEMLLVRRMSDVNLSLFPLAKVRLRLGWSRVVNEGSSFSSTHQGTEGLLFQPTSNATDNYQFGVSLRLIPRTSFSYDQFFTYFKGDTTAQLNSLPFALAGGIPVDLGLPFNAGFPGAANQPCATPLLAGGIANPACNGYFSYNRTRRTRNNFPTEQVSFQSNYFRRLDLSGRFNYSNAEADMPSSLETFSGLITRTAQRSFQTTGGSLAHRVSASADLGLTVSVTDRFRIVDTFRFENFRIPGSWDLLTTSLFGATLLSTPNAFNPATCLPPLFNAPACPQHSASSGADITADVLNQFFKQDRKVNTIELEYDFTRRISGHLGYRYEHRTITHNIADVQNLTFFPTLPNRTGACPVLPPDGVCTTTTTAADGDITEINGHSALAGFSARPTDALRIIFDTELFSADKTFTRISPRQMQTYRLRANYKPVNWVNLGGAVTIFENRNNTADIGNLQHNRSYAFTATLAPAEAKWGLDLSYDYNDVFSQTNICFVAPPPPPPGSLPCGGPPFNPGISFYKDRAHTGSGSVHLKPIPRLTAAVGYTITSTTGNTLILNQLAPTGPLSFNYHLPSASLAFEISKNFSYKASWNYYDYNEKSASGPTLPRDFRGNTFTFSVRYSM